MTVTAAVAATSATILTTAASPNHQKPSIDELCIEKYGNLAKLGGKLKTWRKRWFHLSSTGVLRYWKSQVNELWLKTLQQAGRLLNTYLVMKLLRKMCFGWLHLH